MKKVVYCICIFMLLAVVKVSSAQNSDIRLISPIGAAIRSAFLPGWGQMYAGSKIHGSILLFSSGALVASGFTVRSSAFRIYNDKYIQVKLEALDNPQNNELQQKADHYFDQANQRFKLSQFFFFAALGVWAYGVVESYVDGNIYNAQVKSEELRKDVQKIENMEFQFDNIDNGHIQISWIKVF